jgi:hypothetical protein
MCYKYSLFKDLIRGTSSDEEEADDENKSDDMKRRAQMCQPFSTLSRSAPQETTTTDKTSTKRGGKKDCFYAFVQHFTRHQLTRKKAGNI